MWNMQKTNWKTGFLAIALPIFLSASASATDKFAKVQVKAADLGGGVHMLTGKGGNIGLFAGPDGAFMIDSQFKGLNAKLTKAIAKITDKKLKFVVNTHWHFDHVGGNEAFGKKGAVIVAHENVRKLMLEDQLLKAFNKKVSAAPKNALPSVTFGSELIFHLNNETVKVIHAPTAHTSGDAMIHFIKADVIHMGDIYFNGFYPFIDFQHGGTVKGMVAAVDRVLAIAGPFTKIIPGHGPLSNRAELQNYRDMLDAVGSKMAAAIKAGKSLAEMTKNSPFSAFDKEWGDGFLKPQKFLELVYNGMKKG